jgi:hypothetical protein
VRKEGGEGDREGSGEQQGIDGLEGESRRDKEIGRRADTGEGTREGEVERRAESREGTRHYLNRLIRTKTPTQLHDNQPKRWGEGDRQESR